MTATPRRIMTSSRLLGGPASRRGTARRSSASSWMKRIRYDHQEMLLILATVLPDLAGISVQNLVRSLGWNLLPPLVQVLRKKEDEHLPQCLAIFNHLIKVHKLAQHLILLHCRTADSVVSQQGLVKSESETVGTMWTKQM